MARKETRTMRSVRLLKKYDVKIENLNKQKLKDFKEECKKLVDPRIKKKSIYKIWDIVVVSFIAVIAECNSWDEIHLFAKKHYDWFKSFLQLTGGIPPACTYERIIALINPKELESMLVFFVRSALNIFSDSNDIYCFDGKTDNGSSRNKNELRKNVKALNVLNVYSSKHQMCVASEAINKKTNEITVIPNLIKKINIKGSIATWDALNTQKKTVKAVIDAKGDYVGALKKNQGNFYEDVALYFKGEQDIIRAREYGYLKEIEKSHSSVITYEYFHTEDIKWYFDYHKWTGLKSIGMVQKTIIKNGKTSVEKRYYISSLGINVKLLAKAIRIHWQVENKLHWHLDYTFNQDKNRTMNKNALLNLQLLKKCSLSLLSDAQVVYDCSLKLIRKSLAIDFEHEILRFFNIIARHNKRFF